MLSDSMGNHRALLGEGQSPGGESPRRSPDSKRLASGAWNPHMSDCIVREENGTSTPITSPHPNLGCEDWLPDNHSMVGVHAMVAMNPHLTQSFCFRFQLPRRQRRRRA